MVLSAPLPETNCTRFGAQHRNQLKLFPARTPLEEDRHPRRGGVGLPPLRGVDRHAAQALKTAVTQLARRRAVRSRECGPPQNLLRTLYTALD